MLPSVAEVLLQSIAPDELVEYRRARAERIAAAGVTAAMDAIATATAEAFDLCRADALHAVMSLPRNAVDLLSTPQGWSVISQHVAMQLLGETAYIMPTVH